MLMSLIATGSSSARCRATHTEPMPPRASTRSSRYFPAMTVPSISGMEPGSPMGEIRSGRMLPCAFWAGEIGGARGARIRGGGSALDGAGGPGLYPQMLESTEKLALLQTALRQILAGEREPARASLSDLVNNHLDLEAGSADLPYFI